MIKRVCDQHQLINQKVLSFQEVYQKTQNGDQNRIYPSLTLQTARFFPLKRVLKNTHIHRRDESSHLLRYLKEHSAILDQMYDLPQLNEWLSQSEYIIDQSDNINPDNAEQVTHTHW